MEDELEAEEVLELILDYLGAHKLAGPDRTEGHEQLLDSVNAAIADHPDDARKQAAAALAVVTAYGMLIGLEEFEQILLQLRRIEGLASIRDVHYVELGSRRDRAVSLRSLLSETQDNSLDEEDRIAIERFIGSTLDVDIGAPPDDIGGGPRP